MNWQQQIEAQIADLYPEQFEQRESMQALLDVATATEECHYCLRVERGMDCVICDRLDKLREVSDE